MSKICTTPDCGRLHRAKGLCMGCYERKRHNAVAMPQCRKPQKSCKLPGCTRVLEAKGLCHVHYMTLRYYSLPTGDYTRCMIPKCTLRHAAKGYCQAHYLAVRGRAKALEIQNLLNIDTTS